MPWFRQRSEVGSSTTYMDVLKGKQADHEREDKSIMLNEEYWIILDHCFWKSGPHACAMV